MARSRGARATPRRLRVRRVRAACLFAVVAAIAAAFGHQVLASSPPTESAATTSGNGGARQPRRSVPPRVLGVADGAVPDGTTVFDDAVPGVANLDPALLDALRRAAARAAGDGVELSVDSGWRSAEYQEHLLREAVSKYGSKEEAARWVATPDTSAHVSGDAVDIGSRAAAWLSAHGAWYGLCPIYRNEPWHYELRHDAATHGCPPPYADASRDPRLLGGGAAGRHADRSGAGRRSPPGRPAAQG